MAGAIKGIEIAISADTSGVTKGLKEITSASMKTSKNLKTVESLLKLDPGNTELVAHKQKLLAQNIEQTKDKLNKLKAAQDDVKAAFERGDITEEQYIEFQGEIVKTENRLKKLESQVGETSDAIQNVGDTASDTGKSVKDVGDKASDTGKSMKKAGDEASDFGDKLKSGLATAAKAAGVAIAAVATAVVAGTKALAGFTVAGAEYADTILTDSTVTGIATDKLQEYRYAAELVDVSTDTLTKSMAKNIKSMSSAAKGTGDTAAAYKKLGVEVKNSDGSLRDSQEVYWELIDALGQVDNETERDAMAMQILGKSAQELNPLIEAGSARMAELGQQAHDAGAVLSDDALESFGAFDDQLQYLKVNSEAAKNALGTALLPMLTNLATTGNGLLTEFTSNLVKADGDIGYMADAVAKIIPKIVDAIVAALPNILDSAVKIVKSLADGIIQNLPQIVQVAGELVLKLADALIDMLPQIIDVGLLVIAQLAIGIAQALPELIPAIVDVVLQIVETLLDNIDLLIDAAMQLIEGITMGLIDAMPIIISKAPVIVDKLAQAIANNVPKLIELGVKLVVAIVQGIIQNLPAVVEGSVKVVTSLINGIKQYFSNMSQVASELIGRFRDTIRNMASQAFSWGADLIQGLINGIKSKVGAITDAVSGVASKIKSFLHFSVPDEGPLTDYESWMPDFMKGLAAGIERNKYLVTNAVRGLANDMVISPTANMAASGGGYGGMSQVININISANIASDIDIRHVAEKLGQELQTITAQNNAMQGAW